MCIARGVNSRQVKTCKCERFAVCHVIKVRGVDEDSQCAEVWIWCRFKVIRQCFANTVALLPYNWVNCQWMHVLNDKKEKKIHLYPKNFAYTATTSDARYRAMLSWHRLWTRRTINPWYSEMTESIYLWGFSKNRRNLKFLVEHVGRKYRAGYRSKDNPGDLLTTGTKTSVPQNLTRQETVEGRWSFAVNVTFRNSTNGEKKKVDKSGPGLYLALVSSEVCATFTRRDSHEFIRR